MSDADSKLVVRWLRSEYHNRGQSGHSTAADLIEALCARVRELEADAERYRAIRRIHIHTKWADCAACFDPIRPLEEKYVSADGFDFAADAARAA